jgi:hypothetical protein|tara:strand:- start:448 stop:687 length:240 start_codon:yes stop_codon:yes gene_type:complete
MNLIKELFPDTTTDQQEENIDKISFSFHINGTCYASTKKDPKDRVLYQDKKGMFYKKNAKQIYLNENDQKRFKETQGYN